MTSELTLDISGRRSGKTTRLLNRTWELLQMQPGSRVGIVSCTADSVKELKRRFDFQFGEAATTNVSFMSAGSASSSRGARLDALLLDDFDFFLTKNVFQALLPVIDGLDQIYGATTACRLRTIEEILTSNEPFCVLVRNAKRITSTQSFTTDWNIATLTGLFNEDIILQEVFGQYVKPATTRSPGEQLLESSDPSAPGWSV